MNEKLINFNKRCALFLGYKFYNKTINFSRSIDDEITILPDFINFKGEEIQLPSLKFHEDWNLIHEIISAINNEKITSEMNGIKDSIIPYLNAKQPIIKGLLNNDINEVVEGIEKYFEWREKQLNIYVV